MGRTSANRRRHCSDSLRSTRARAERNCSKGNGKYDTYRTTGESTKLEQKEPRLPKRIGRCEEPSKYPNTRRTPLQSVAASATSEPAPASLRTTVPGRERPLYLFRRYGAG